MTRVACLMVFTLIRSFIQVYVKKFVQYTFTRNFDFKISPLLAGSQCHRSGEVMKAGKVLLRT